jgi:nucleoside-diphosphate-sugar epimerase
MELKTVLILGSSGQIGAHLSKYLEAKSYKVLGFDIENSTSEDLRINQNNYFESLVQQSDFVFFLAFDVGGSHYIAKYQNTFDFIDNNLKILLYTINALNALIKSLNNGILDTNFRITWLDYKNSILLIQSNDLNIIKTKIHKIINL